MSREVNDCAVVNKDGKVIRLRPFPRAFTERVIQMNDGTKFIRLTPEQVDVVKVGWVTVDDGVTFV
jgi:hypothetical protein